MGGHEVRDVMVDGRRGKTLVSPDLEATFLPGAGMVGSSLRHRGEELLDLRGGVGQYVRLRKQAGLPLLHPWANRLAGFHYRVDGVDVSLQPGSPLLHLDPHGLPIHGLVTGDPRWEIEAADADGSSARLTAALPFDELPDLLAGFPFPHRLSVEARLAGGVLSMTTTLTATGDRPVPVSFGYHPYLRLPGVPREQWVVTLPVRRRIAVDERLIPTGAREPVDIPAGPLGDRVFDTGFTDVRGPFAIEGDGRRIEVGFGDGYPYAQVFAPPRSPFLCIEPMTAPANALGDGGAGLRRVAPGESFRAVFSIKVS